MEKLKKIIGLKLKIDHEIEALKSQSERIREIRKELEAELAEMDKPLFYSDFEKEGKL